MKAKIKSVYGVFPSKVIQNNDFVTKYGLDTSDEWIKSRTGISQRYICKKNEDIVYLATNAAKGAIKKANINVNDIELILVSTSTSPYSGFPSLACLVQKELKMNHCPAFDINAACTGFSYAITIAQQFIENQQYKNILVISADTLSDLIDWTDRRTCILFGDAAGAVILQATSNKNSGILFSEIKADGQQANILTGDKKHHIHMDGQRVFKTAINYCLPAIKNALNKTGLNLKNIKYIIPHQANQRILDQIKLKLKLSDTQLISSITNYGNTSSATIPTTLNLLDQKNQLQKDDILMLIGFGSGFTWGINIIKWS